MIRLNVVAEGQTEEAFVGSVLVPHLAEIGVYASARCVETSRDRRRRRIFRGGVTAYGKLRKDLIRWMKQDQNPDAHFTTMVDLYGLPDDFPGYLEARRQKDTYRMVEDLERSLAGDIVHPRFVPYIQLHEFEALLLSDPAKLEHAFPGQARAIQALVDLAATFSSPEEIDLGQSTAPSKRIIAEIPEYGDQKASAGPIVAQKIGVARMREKCPHFAGWLDALAALAARPTAT